MKYRSVALAILSTTVGMTLLQATSALSAFHSPPPKAVPVVPANSIEANVFRVVDTEQGPVVLLRPVNSDRCLPIVVGNAEGRAIERGRVSAKSPRPMTHDLFARTIDELDAEVAHVRVDRLTPNGVYIGTVTLVRAHEILAIDARPSDSMALALRTGAKVYIDESLRSELIPLPR